MKNNKYIEINFFQFRREFLVGKGKSRTPIKGSKSIIVGIHVRNMHILKETSSAVCHSNIALDLYTKYLIKQNKYCLDSFSSVLFHNIPQCRTTIYLPYNHNQDKHGV
jgi:hypothetical protein